jgi:diguanylate cyclase (GGDEF)-like protein
VSEKRQAEERAQFLATYDSLTGLLNRERFIECLQANLAANQHGALILVDIDEFKVINDVYGHTLADEFLKHVADLINATAQTLTEDGQCVVGRLGEDEIGVAMPGKTGKDGWQIAETIRQRVERFAFSTDAIRATISAGVVECRTHGATTAELLSHVDTAVFRAKSLGKNRCHLFSPGDHDLLHVHSRLKQRDRILRALDDDRFEPWFQPILDLSDHQIHHYEALARMRDEDGDIVLPGAFISIAEALGFIDAIDRRITAKTIYRQAELQRRGQSVSFAMNISGKNLGDESLLEYLRATIAESGATPGSLIFEITETAAIHDLSQAVTFMSALKQMGCRFALDDFGVGFTSFVYLREMAVDFVKIDGAFIRRLHEHVSDQGIVKAIVMIAREMGIRTIAEFVETEAALAMLQAFGVDYAQGFLIGKPAPLA